MGSLETLGVVFEVNDFPTELGADGRLRVTWTEDATGESFGVIVQASQVAAAEVERLAITAIPRDFVAGPDKYWDVLDLLNRVNQQSFGCWMTDPSGSGRVQFRLSTYLKAQLDEPTAGMLGSVAVDEVQSITQALRRIVSDGWDAATTFAWLESEGMAQ